MLLFADIASDPADVAAYDGVWASACLLHVARADFADVLARIRRVLKPAGVLYASFKAADAAHPGEGADTLGRLYNYPDEAWLRAAFGRLCAGTPQWADVAIDTLTGGGGDTAPTIWLHALARRA